MKEILCKQSKETRCYIMSAVMFFEGFNQVNKMTEIRGEMLLDVLGLTREDIERFPLPDYSQIVSHLKAVSDPEVRSWVIRNTYSPVLKSKRADALKAFRMFCADVRWDANEIKEKMRSTEELYDMKPIDNGVKSTTNSGCLSIIVLIVISTVLFAFAII